ncbi:DUF4145 domain-containing protein [Zwartia sp.]|uniref:DUF4145 domain-containing protein n=1 Tax=Zwartia sp. TaxID=2978004 RepID=UPI002720A902|nr:DUF4145 domain-containing protein [Zwartia sp.]MDO9025298.1 DUF4145 domain-containing protein [Zwartia sp.]
MSELVANCPRCASKHITFDVDSAKIYRQEYGWQNWYEAFSTCRHCAHSTIFLLAEKVESNYEQVHRSGLLNMNGALNHYIDVRGFVSLKDVATIKPPQFLPASIEAVFIEGSTCLAVGCFNAAGTMFRLCVDMATKGMLPANDFSGLNSKIRRDLGLRLPWLFQEGLLNESLRELSTCIKDDGNDGAHAGTLTSDDANELLDFTSILLERIYTEPERLRQASQRRIERRFLK